MIFLLLLLTTTAISAAAPAAPIVQQAGWIGRPLEVMCAEEVFAARIDGNSEREQYYLSFMKQWPAPTNLAQAIVQLKASIPKSWPLAQKNAFSAPMDKAPLWMAMCHSGLFGKHVNPLLQHGVDVCQAGPWGDTPLMIAARKEDHGLVLMLLGRGAKQNINVANKNGLTALTEFYLCAMPLNSKQYSIISTLLDKGALAVDQNTLPETMQKQVHAATVARIQKIASYKSGRAVNG